MSEDSTTLYNLIKEQYPDINIYISPPTDTFDYPVIICEFLRHIVTYSNNVPYIVGSEFQVSLLDTLPPINLDTRLMLNVPNTRNTTAFTSGGIRHTIFVVKINST